MRQLQSAQEAAAWLQAKIGTGSLHTDSRQIKWGDGFIAWPGAAVDGRQYVSNSLAAGASACLVEAEGVETFSFNDERIACLKDLKAASGLVAAQYFGHPSSSLDIIAVTGTNGKTSTAWWLAQALNAYYENQSLLKSEQKSKQVSHVYCGLVGTLGVGFPGNMQFTGLTTPDPVMLQTQFARLQSMGAKACAIEASSIGIAEHRLAGTQVRCAIFTNFTQDHLDYHGSMKAYWQAKLELFKCAWLETAVVNLDDEKSTELMTICNERGMQVLTYSAQEKAADFVAENIQYSKAGMSFDVIENSQIARIVSPALGEFNIANLLGVIAAMRSLGLDLKSVCQAIESCTAVPGRMQTLQAPDAPQVVIDYAHTPDALEKAIAALKPSADARGGTLWCVFGCGGNRDASKRPLMARAAQAAAHIVLTSDNPRNESAQEIMAQVMLGFDLNRAVHQQSDRALAIVHAINQADARDVILIAGKGHEDYQEILNIKTLFSDVDCAQAAIKSRASMKRHLKEAVA